MMINAFSNFRQFGLQGQQNVRRNPDDYAQSYATQNGLTLEEAKATLKSQYGDPEENSQVSLSSDFGYDNETSAKSLEKFDIKTLFQELLNLLRGPQKTQNSEKQEGLPQDQDPDSYAQEYADVNGLTLEEAKAELEAKYGKPQNPDQNFTVNA